MKFAFCLIKYFTFGGLQRSFLQIARTCGARGHEIDVFTPEWDGDVPQWLNLKQVKVKGFTNHRRRESLAEKLAEHVKRGSYDAVVGFSKMPGLDIYYAGDACFAAHAEKKSRVYRLTPRCRRYLDLERAVFDSTYKTRILLVSELEKTLYQKYYGTADERFHILPPNLSAERMAPPNAGEMRAELRNEFDIGRDDYVILMVGSGFRTKGVDRSLEAVAALPESIRAKTWLIIIGKDNFSPFRRMAKKLKVADNLLFFPGRPDILRFMVGADLLLHPAYRENTGTVLLEAMAAGLPVLVTDVCGFAPHVKRADAGRLVLSPFQQKTLNKMLIDMLTSARKHQWSANGKTYVSTTDLYSRSEKAASIIEEVAS